MIWLLLAAATVAIVARAPGRVASQPQRVAAKPVRVDLPPDQQKQPEQGQREIVTEDPWHCGKADSQPMPDVAAMLPPGVVQLGGPIAMAIAGGIETVRKIFDALGPDKVCTVGGGLYVPILVVQRGAGRWIEVDIEPMYGGAPAGRWTFSATRSGTGPLPLQAKIEEQAPRQLYLMRGGKPPGDLWPHTLGTPRWRSSVTQQLEQPAVDVIREGDDLTVYVWLPPRAPRSHVNAWGKRRVDHPVTWRISWAVK